MLDSLLQRTDHNFKNGFITAAQPHPRRQLFAMIELSGNGLTFEIRDSTQYWRPLADDDPLLPYIQHIMVDDANKQRRYKQKLQLNNAAEIAKTGHISDETLALTMKQLYRARKIINDLEAQGHNVTVKAVGTAPLRNANNSLLIRERIFDEIGFHFEPIEDSVEAYFTAMGFLNYYPKASGLMIDVGGGSTELILLEDGQIIATDSVPYGTSNINGCRRDAKKAFKEVDSIFWQAKTLIPAGGTLRNVSKTLAENMGINIKNEVMHTIDPLQYCCFMSELSDMKSKKWKHQPLNLRERRKKLSDAAFLFSIVEGKLKQPHDIALTKTKTRDGLSVVMHYEQKWPDHLQDLQAQASTSLNAIMRLEAA